MMLTVSGLLGITGLPATAMGLRKWLHRSEVPLLQDGKRFTFNLSDLPAPVRLAYVTRQISAAGLPVGTYDEVAHEAFAELPPKMRASAERKAEIARLLLTAGKALSWPQRAKLARERFGDDGTSQPSLTRVLRAVEGVDPINFAPALAAGYRLEGAPRVEVSEAAWSFFMTTIRDAGPQFPIKQAWRDVRDLKASKGWDWPSWPTIFRRWDSLPEAQKLHARHGHSEAVKALGQPALRDKTSILPLEWVSLDGRTKDFWAHSGDGKARRYTFLALVDCASDFILDWELAESENARSPVFEVAQFQPHFTDETFLRRCDGRILKWLDPLNTCLPGTMDVGPVLWLDRDHVQQAASFTKLCALWSQDLPRQRGEGKLPEQFAKATASAVARLSAYCNFTRLSFETILADPLGSASLLARHFRPLGMLDVRAAASVVKSRLPACQPEMEFSSAAALQSFRSFRLET